MHRVGNRWLVINGRKCYPVIVLAALLEPGWREQEPLLRWADRRAIEMKIGDPFNCIKNTWSRLPIWIIITLVFIIFIVLNIVTAFFLSDVPSPEAACRRQCLEIGKEGSLEPIYPEVVTRGMRSRGPVECRCR